MRADRAMVPVKTVRLARFLVGKMLKWILADIVSGFSASSPKADVQKDTCPSGPGAATLEADHSRRLELTP